MEEREVSIDCTLYKTINQLEKKCRRILRSSKEDSHRKEEASKLSAELSTLKKLVETVESLTEYSIDYNIMAEDSDSYDIITISFAELKKMTAKKQKRIHKYYNKDSNILLSAMSSMDENGHFPLDWTGIDEKKYVNIVEIVETHKKPGFYCKRFTTFYVAIRNRLF